MIIVSVCKFENLHTFLTPPTFTKVQSMEGGISGLNGAYAQLVQIQREQEQDYATFQLQRMVETHVLGLLLTALHVKDTLIIFLSFIMKSINF